MKIVATRPAMTAIAPARRDRVERGLPAKAIDGEQAGKDVLRIERRTRGTDGPACHFRTDGPRLVPELPFQTAFVAQVLGQLLEPSADRRLRAENAYASQTALGTGAIFIRAV